MASTDMHRKITPISEEVATKFWSSVDVCGKDECWEWLGGRAEEAYGSFSYDGQTWGAHRIAYFLSYGPFNERLFVCHHCDWKHCVSPRCLFLGTNRENNLDARAKGLIHPAVGTELPQAKFTDETAKEALRLYQSGKMNMNMIAKKFGVDRGTVSPLINRKTWKHLNIPRISIPYNKWCHGDMNGNASLTEDIVRSIRKDFTPGVVTAKMLSERYGVCILSIQRVVYGHSWVHVK